MKKSDNFMTRNRTRILCSSAVISTMAPFAAFAADEASGATMSTVLGNVTTLLTWITGSMTSICTWVIGNALGSIYLGIFIIGAAVAMLFRVLHSA